MSLRTFAAIDFLPMYVNCRRAASCYLGGKLSRRQTREQVDEHTFILGEREYMT